MTQHPRPQLFELFAEMGKMVGTGKASMLMAARGSGKTEALRARAAQRGGEIIGWHHHAFFAPPATVADITGPGMDVPPVATVPLNSDTPCRAVILRATCNGQSREYVDSVPSHWNAGMIRFHRNESGWCAGNLYGDLRACGVSTDWLPHEDEDGPCLCGDVEIEYVREATAEEAARIKP